MPGVTRRKTALAVMMTLPVLIGCGRDDARISIRLAGALRSTASSREVRTRIRRGDVEITTSDSSFVVALAGDSIVTGFGAKVLDRIRERHDSVDAPDSGLVARADRLERLLTSKLADAMGHQVKYAVDKIRDVRFDGERLQFYWIDGSRTRLFTDSPSSDRAAAETFRPQDAERFIAAFRAKKAAGAQR